MTLADEFRQSQLDVCAELIRDTPYRPTRFLHEIGQHTGDEAVEFTCRLIMQPVISSSGFRRMLALDRATQTIEYQVLLEQWRPLFGERPDDVLDMARWRLTHHGVTPPDAVVAQRR
ncbi:hypothetical protein [Pseudonocardia endophytica]|nr:hypothetical protein [Pseudonocardia endophytica]